MIPPTPKEPDIHSGTRWVGDAVVSGSGGTSRGPAGRVADLDAAAPALNTVADPAFDRRALLVLALATVLLLTVAWFLLARARTPGKPAPPAAERLTVSAAPRLALPAPRRPAEPAAPVATPIPLLAPRPLPPLPATAAAPATLAAPAPTLMERRMADHAAMPMSDDGVRATAGMLPDGLSPAGLNAGAAAGAATPTIARTLPHRSTLMARGTYIRCVLETRIVSDVPGFTSCLVTEPVYSFDGSRLLLPQGSKILGAYDKGPVGRRLAVVWDRIITPDGVDLGMASPGTDGLGGAGLPGRYDAHWGSRIGSALLISLLGDAFKYEAARLGPRSTTITNGVVTQEPFESNTARTVQELAGQAVRESANRPPTLTIAQGSIVYVYVARDVDFHPVLARD